MEPVCLKRSKLSLNLKSVPVQDVIKQIEDLTEFNFIYLDEVFRKDQTITLQTDQAPIDSVMQQLAEQASVQYRIFDRQIVILTNTTNESPSILKSETNAEQKKQLSGTVKDSKGLPLPGVSVVVKGTTIGIITDVDGNFRLSVPAESKIIVFSFIGMKSQEIAIAGNTSFSILLKEEVVSVEEVVAVGYGTQKKANLTGSVSTVGSHELTVVPVASTTNTLAGRLTGLISKQESGAPGKDNATLSIRGFGNPLVIVDGIAQDFNNIDPNEIESISVLKDAAAAIYGARSGNGVILVTTKRGTSGKPTIKLNSSYTLQGITLYPKPLNSGQYAEIMREGQINNGVQPGSTRFSEEDIAKYYAGNDPNYPNTDWWSAIMNNWAPQQQHNLSMTGGNDKIRYYGFLGYLNQQGMYKSGDNKYNRYNIRSNIDANITKNLSVALDLSTIMESILNPSRSDKSIWMDFYDAQPIYLPELPDKSKIPWAGSAYSPIANTTRSIGGYRDDFKETIKGSLSMEYKIPMVKGLSFKALVNYLQYSTTNKNWIKKVDVYKYDGQSDTYTLAGSTGNTTLDQKFAKSYNITTQVSLNYNRVFATNHEVSGLLLYETINGYSSNFSAHRENYLFNSIDYLFAGGTVGQKSDGSATESGRASLIGRLNYAYKSKYLLEATMRYDASSVFPKDSRWGFFPSVSAGWRISEEGFIKNNVSWINNLKLRSGFSNTGYDATGNFQYMSGYAYSGTYIVGGEGKRGIISTGLANPGITWENMTTYNLGLDLSVLKGKIYTEADIFYRKRDGMLATRLMSLPSTFGATLPAENINSQDSRGFEIKIGHRGSIGKVNYDVSGNMSWARAKWIHYEESTYTDSDQIRINKLSGNWTNRRFGYKSDGLFTSQEEINNLGFDQDGSGNTTLYPGDVKYIDLNKDGKLDWRDVTLIGRTDDPELMFGINVNIQYKGFDFGMLWQGAANRNFYINNCTIASQRNPPEVMFKERWTPENNNRNAIIPRVTYGNNSNNTQNSDYWLRDASYIRLKSLNLGYTFPKKILSRVSIEELRVYIAGFNLLTFDGLSVYGFDPECPVVEGGWYYPQQRTWTFGLNISL